MSSSPPVSPNPQTKRPPDCPEARLTDRLAQLKVTCSIGNAEHNLVTLEKPILEIINRHLADVHPSPTRARRCGPEENEELWQLQRKQANPALETLKLAASCQVFREMKLTLTIGHRVCTQNLLMLAGEFTLVGCFGMRHMPPNELRRLATGCQALAALDLSFCVHLDSLQGLAEHPCLERLKLHKCTTLTDISAVSTLPKLVEIDLSECPKLVELELLTECPALEVIKLEGRSNLSQIDKLASSEGGQLRLSLERNRDLSEIEKLTSADRIGTLSVSQSTDLKSLAQFKGLTKLKRLEMRFCTTLSNLDDIGHLPELSVLILHLCGNLRVIDPLNQAVGLQHLDLSGCGNLPSLEPLRPLAKLQRLDLHRCSNLKDCTAAAGMLALEWVNLEDCHHLRSLEGFEQCPVLTEIHMPHNYNIEDIRCLASSNSIRRLELSQCLKLRRLPDTSEMSLEYLALSGAICLQNLRPIFQGKSLKVLLLDGCIELPLAGKGKLKGVEQMLNLVRLDLTGAGIERNELSGVIKQFNFNVQTAKFNSETAHVRSALLPCCPEHLENFRRHQLPLPRAELNKAHLNYIDTDTDVLMPNQSRARVDQPAEKSKQPAAKKQPAKKKKKK